MSFLQVLAYDANKQLENISSFYVNHILPYVKSRSSYTVVAAAVVAYFSYRVRKMSEIPKNLQHIPAVPYWPFMRSLLSGESIDHRTRKYVLPVIANSPNGLYLRPIRRGWTVGVAGPATMKRLLLRADDFEKSPIFAKQDSLFNKFMGKENIVLLNGSVWKKHRLIANPAFHRSMPVKLFGRLCEKMMLRFEKEGDGLVNVDVANFLQRFTLDAIGLAAFGYDFEALDCPENEKVDTYNSIMTGIQNAVYFIFPILEKRFLWALPKRRDLYRKLDDMNEIFYSVIQHKRDTLASMKHSIEDTEKDLLTLMLEANEEAVDADHRLSDLELRDNLAIFFLAGHDTTSNALTFALYFLAANLPIQEKARKEVLDIMGDGDDIVFPTSTQCTDMKYVYMIMKETLRMCPPAVGTSPRRSNKDMDLVGTLIPEGTPLNADIYSMHHDPNIWQDPETFIPERFASNGESESKAGRGLAWAPFGNGARQCIGMNFSLAEQKVLLSMLLRKFTWELPEDSINKDGLKIGGGIGIMHAKDMHLKFTKRF
ncbi:hypothetical protein INT44_004972 [Umbelopsis vinacea]|uniref:Cytochrome P450 n=1 Tax=Umbelopsis vinacea TaxID=44442 RepID=A0A8H7Q764_9FUNG|nr:hypothetical protein INT44_004972 [Umbelopsis vinacea]